MDDAVYRQWRTDISAEYVIRTGRAFARANTNRGEKLRVALVEMSDRDDPPSPIEAVDELIDRGLLLPDDEVGAL
jgi:hypothetical protein